MSTGCHGRLSRLCTSHLSPKKVAKLCTARIPYWEHPRTNGSVQKTGTELECDLFALLHVAVRERSSLGKTVSGNVLLCVMTLMPAADTSKSKAKRTEQGKNREAKTIGEEMELPETTNVDDEKKRPGRKEVQDLAVLRLDCDRRGLKLFVRQMTDSMIQAWSHAPC
eukprot:gnl/TRDRNA2_/TRDRNA2_175061_c8_seq18.p2 gnl/TRDRNA2_/TRDRNA2_175061_c8~~gnl/TRDRNA2_/TRDRNA2_175061_c8_seq18.p2  ORF type:complete len:167 (+),score=15.88 gnl/TRDRNA2_/TRDRNA2_175061_c8_seq18:29-529(+)